MQLPDYDFKLLPKALKAAGIAVAIFLLTLLLDFNDDLDAILTDWEAYARSMGPALLAVMATALLGVMTRRRGAVGPPAVDIEELRDMLQLTRQQRDSAEASLRSREAELAALLGDSPVGMTGIAEPVTDTPPREAGGQ